jgi:hypothetical protein
MASLNCAAHKSHINSIGKKNWRQVTWLQGETIDVKRIFPMFLPSLNQPGLTWTPGLPPSVG